MNCIHCHHPLPDAGLGTGTRQRNHCPHCLYSRHVDDAVGDRGAVATCGASMKPLGIIERKTGELALLHECTRCGKRQPNRIAGDDDVDLILRLVEDLQHNEMCGEYTLLCRDDAPRVAAALLGTQAAAARYT